MDVGYILQFPARTHHRLFIAAVEQFGQQLLEQTCEGALEYRLVLQASMPVGQAPRCQFNDGHKTENQGRQADDKALPSLCASGMAVHDGQKIK